MLTILGISLTYETIGAFALFLTSEYLGSNPKIASNSVAQYVIAAIRGIGLIRKEDDQIKQIKRILGGEDDN